MDLWLDIHHVFVIGPYFCMGNWPCLGRQVIGSTDLKHFDLSWVIEVGSIPSMFHLCSMLFLLKNMFHFSFLRKTTNHPLGILNFLICLRIKKTTNPPPYGWFPSHRLAWPSRLSAAKARVEDWMWRTPQSWSETEELSPPQLEWPWLLGKSRSKYVEMAF